VQWHCGDAVPADLAAAVDGGLGDYNAGRAPLGEVRSLAVAARLDDGRVVGGAIGRTWGACCELQQLWVDPAQRGRGIGSGLMQRFERQARERGCSVFYLETFSFQAEPFYAALGYRAIARIDGFPDGIAKFLMQKISG
jgi:GNAT superfamily N-acetyltransferase